MGNFVGHHTLATSGVAGVTGILQVSLGQDGSCDAGDLVPLTIAGDGIPRPDPAKAVQGIVRRLSRKNFGGRGMLVSPAGFLRPPAS
jgi:hypothetical protein